MHFQTELDDSLLYKVWREPPGTYRIQWGHYHTPDSIPDIPDPYPFITAELGPQIIEKYGQPYAPQRKNYWDVVKTEGIETLVWRRYPRHITPGWMTDYKIFSQEVFEAIEALAPGTLKSTFSFIAEAPGGDSKLRCNIVEVVAGTSLEGVVKVQTAPISFELDSLFFYDFRKREQAGVTDTRIEIQRTDLPDGIFAVPEFRYGEYTTTDFIRRWRETEISQNLRNAYFEDDFFFAPYEPYPGVFVKLN